MIAYLSGMQEWFAPVLFSIAVAAWLGKGKLPPFILAGRTQLVLGWMIKILLTICFHWVYSEYYTDQNTGDTWKYFKEAKKLYNCSAKSDKDFVMYFLGKEPESTPASTCFADSKCWFTDEGSGFINDARLVIRLNFLLMPISRGNYLLHLFIFSFIGFCGLWISYEWLIRQTRNSRPTLIWLISFCLPTLVFWSSGILKEALILPVLALFLHAAEPEKRNPKKIFLSIVLGLLICFIKFYVGLALLATLGITECIARIPVKSMIAKISLVLVSIVFICMLLDLSGNQKIPSVIEKKQIDFVNLARGGDYWTLLTGDTIHVVTTKNVYKVEDNRTFLKKNAIYYTWVNLKIGDTLVSEELELKVCLASIKPAGSSFDISPIQPTWTGLLAAMPKATVNAIFRPYFYELKNPFIWFSWFENWSCILFLSAALWWSLMKKNLGKKNLTLLLNFIIFSFFLLGIIGITTPVTGAIVRYRLPFLWFASMLAGKLWSEKKLT